MGPILLYYNSHLLTESDVPLPHSTFHSGMCVMTTMTVMVICISPQPQFECLCEDTDGLYPITWKLSFGQSKNVWVWL